MKKYGAVDVDMKDIIRISVRNFVNTYSQENRTHWVKEDFLGTKFLKQEGIN